MKHEIYIQEILDLHSCYVHALREAPSYVHELRYLLISGLHKQYAGKMYKTPDGRFNKIDSFVLGFDSGACVVKVHTTSKFGLPLTYSFIPESVVSNAKS